MSNDSDNTPSISEGSLIARVTQAIQSGDLGGALQLAEEQLTSAANGAPYGEAMEIGKALWQQDKATGIKFFETAVSTARNELDWARGFINLLLFRELYKRDQDGLPPYHTDTLDDLGVHCSPEEVSRLLSVTHAAAQDSPEDYGVARLKSTADFISGNYLGAEKSYQHAGTCRPGQIDSNVKFNPSFYESLGQLRPIDHLPATFDILPSDLKGNALFLACDSNYFVRFATPLMRSVQSHSPGCQVHIHAMMPQQAHAELIAKEVEKLSDLAIRVTGEVIPPKIAQNQLAAGCYYHGVRFIRLAQYLEAGSSTMWLVDVDAIVNRDIRPVFEKMTNKDVGLRIRPGRTEPWNQFSACLVAASPSPNSKAYFRLVSAYLFNLLAGPGLAWGADQLALFGVHRYLAEKSDAPDLVFWGPDVTDVSDYEPDSFFWFAAGKKKILYVQNPDLTPDTETDRRFWSQFRKHVG